MVTLRVKEYGGKPFEHIRRSFVPVSDFLHSWSKSGTGEASNSTGKSGARFFFSYDKKYLIKTISLQEARWLVKILPAYINVNDFPTPITKHSKFVNFFFSAVFKR